MLEVSRAAHYEQRKHIPSRRSLDDADLTERISSRNLIDYEDVLDEGRSLDSAPITPFVMKKGH